MTQHIFKSKTKDGRQVEVLAGWDRPLQGFFMVIENPEKDDDYIFSNFELKQPHPMSFDVFEKALSDLGIPMPNGLLAELNQDRLENLGNKRKVWESTSQADAAAPEVAVSWVGTTAKARAVDANGSTVAVRYGGEVCALADVLGRLEAGEMGDDLPILLAGFGCDDEAAAELVFSGDHKKATEMLNEASVASIVVNKAAAVERFKNLIFPLHDIWHLVHASKDLELKDECGKIIRACGDFQEGFSPNEPFNDRIHAALTRCKPLVDSTVFVSDTLKARLNWALSKGRAITAEESIDKESAEASVNRPRN